MTNRYVPRPAPHRIELSGDLRFPILTERGAAPHPLTVPWLVAELAYSVYAQRFGQVQSLERLAERGGLGPSEMDRYLPDWRTMAMELDSQDLGGTAWVAGAFAAYQERGLSEQAALERARWLSRQHGSGHPAPAYTRGHATALPEEAIALLREWSEALAAERAEARNAARARASEGRKWPEPPKGSRDLPPLVAFAKLTPEQQGIIGASMPAINEAEAAHRATRARLAAAQEAAREWLARSANADTAGRLPGDGGQS